MSTAEVARVEGLAFGARLAGFDLAVAPGTVWGLVGPNGAGKTTTLRLLAGLMRPTAGGGHVLGRDLARPALRAERPGYMPQAAATPPPLTVLEYLRLRAGLTGVPRAAAAAVLTDLDLARVGGRRLDTLSGGWLRRVDLAAALVGAPRLALLDEPTTGLDHDARGAIWALIRRLAADGTAIIVNTHDLHECGGCDGLVFIAEGRPVAAGTPAQLLARAGADTLTQAWPALAGRA